MARSVTPDLYPEVRPAELLTSLAPVLRRLKALAYLSVALLLIAVGGSFLPLGTWLLLTLAVAVPTVASLILVAAD